MDPVSGGGGFMSTLVSFVIPSFNRRDEVRTALTQIRARGYAFPYQVIIADNGSRDDTVALVHESFPEVLLLPLGRNLGAGSRNEALKQADGTFVVMLDDDSYPLDGAVEGALRVFAADAAETVGCVAFNILQTDGTYWTNGLFSAFTGCGAIFRREVFERVGGYPDDFVYYAEEYDVSCRMTGAGYRILNFAELQCFHSKAGENRSFEWIMNRLVRNNMVIWRRYLPRDLAGPQIETELWRYERIARKEGVLDGYLAGLVDGEEASRRYLADDNPLRISDEAARRMLCLPAIESRVGAMAADHPGASVAVAGLGKTAHLILEVLAEHGLRTAAIVEDNDCMRGETFAGVPIIGRDDMARLDFDHVLIGSLSIAASHALATEFEGAANGRPVTGIADYDRLADHV